MYDLIVVGAGPAGSSAARRAAQQGLNTLLIEKERVPRHKLCGGAITSKVLTLLDFKLPDTVVERTVNSTRIHVGQDNYPFETTRTLAILTSRTSFDAFLTEKALEAGSEVADANPVLKVETDPSNVEVTTKNGRYRSKLVIGADGITGPTARSTHLHSRWTPPQIAYAIESEVIVGERAVLDFVGANHYFDLYFGVSPAGYGWVFPKNDHLTVGIGCRLSKLGDARLLFETFTKTIPFLKDYKIPYPKAHLVPLGGAARVPIAGNRVMLAGDSAGFAEPFLGEGIYFAILSGQIAAKAATNACENDKFTAKSLQQYDTECMHMFGKDLQVAYRLACSSYLQQYNMETIAKFFLSEKRAQECMIGLMDGTIRYRDARVELMWPYLKYRLSRWGLRLYNE